MKTISRAKPVAQPASPGAVRVRVEVAATPARVWDALTRPDRVALWFGDLGAPLADRVSTRLDFGDADFFTIEDVRTERPLRLSYRWCFLGRGPVSEVSWDVSASSSPACSTVTVTDEEPNRSAESVAELTEGWTDFLQRLEEHLATNAVTRYDWRRSFEGAAVLPLSASAAAARLLGEEVEGAWMPFDGAAITEGAVLRTGGQAEPYTVSALERDRAELRFALASERWRSPTRCSVRITAHGTGSLLAVEHTEWDEIGEDVSPIGERRRFADLWIAALDRAKTRATGAEEKRTVEVVIGSVPVFVSDQDRALEFYRNKLGFELTLEFPMAPGVRWLTLAPQHGATELILFHPSMAGAQADEISARVGTWTGIVLLTENCRAQYQELLALGVEFTTPPKQPFWGGWMAEFADPDGNRFQLVERPGYMLHAVNGGTNSGAP